jgi:hypothetical protein
MHGYESDPPEVRDTTARNLLWVLLGVSIINMAMLGYVFYVVERAVTALHQLSQLGQ